MMMNMNLLGAYICEKIMNGDVEKMQNNLLKKQIAYYAMRNEETAAMSKEVDLVLRGIEEQLPCFKAYLAETEGDDSAAALNAAIHKIESMRGPIYSGNVLIDSILSQKLVEAENAEISVALDVQSPKDLQAGADLCVILGNALENSIEACTKLEKNKRTISINIHYDKEALYIEITNPYAGELRYDSRGELASTKADKKYHGFGVRNIKKLIKRNAYSMTIHTEDHSFKLQILMPGQGGTAGE